MLMMVKTGRRRLSGKAMYRLEQAEREAGIKVEEDSPQARPPPSVREARAEPAPTHATLDAKLDEILRRLDALEKKGKK